MATRLLILTLVSTFSTACASAPPGPSPDSLAGTYEFTVTSNTRTIPGVLTIEKGEDGYTGSLRSEGELVPILSVAVADQKVTIRANSPAGPLVIEASVTETGLEGTWRIGEGAGSFRATKVATEDQ